MSSVGIRDARTVRPQRGFSQRGFSLVEVLVTLVIVAIGLLGMVGLQVSSIKLGLIAENRSNAVLYVNNILDRMRSNTADINGYAISFGATAPTGSTQAEKDLVALKSQIAAYLPDGDIDIVVQQGTVLSCDAPLVAKCWDVTIQMRWNETTAKAGKSGAAQKFIEVSSRI
jgi:type IV pilus assembly protein PilV